MLGFKQNEFIKTLIEDKILYRDQANNLLPYATYHDKGYFEIKVIPLEGKNVKQTRVIGLGLDTLSKKYRK